MASLAKVVRAIANAPLNRGNRVRTVVRFMTWQIPFRIAGGQLVIRWIDEARLVIRRGQTALTGNYYAGLFEYEEMAFVLHALRPEDLFVDVGANFGVFTVMSAKVVGAKTVCFEPLPSTFAGLKQQLRLNGIEQQVEAYNRGVGDEAGVLNFTSDRGAMNRAILGSIRTEGRVQQVEITTLDAVVTPDRPFILKIDVEGFESRVLRGAGTLLSSPLLQAVIVELNGSGHAYGVADSHVHDMLVSYGLKPSAYEPVTRKLRYLEGFNDHGNTLYIREIASLHERCRSAPKRVIHTAFGQQI